jgi:hypothetical protein
MPFTNAEKQQRYRERPLGVEGKKARVLLFLSVTARARLNRLARHEGGADSSRSWPPKPNGALVGQLKPKALRAYYDD